MSSRAHHHDETSDPPHRPLATAALVLVAAADLLVRYGAARLSEAFTHHSRPP